MNERFTLDSTVTEISENERVNKKLPIFFDLALCSQIKWPFSKMKLKNMMKMTKFPGQELVDAANFILERREAGDKITIPIWRGLPENEAEAAEYVVLFHLYRMKRIGRPFYLPGLGEWASADDG